MIVKNATSDSVLSNRDVTRSPNRADAESRSGMSSGPALTCPVADCSETRPDTGRLAGHLVMDHMMAAGAAFAQARTASTFTVPPAPQESAAPQQEEPRMGGAPPPMSERTCGHCQQKGHRRDHCPTVDGNKGGGPAPAGKQCHYCHRKDGSHTPSCRRTPGRSPAATTNGTRPATADNEARATAKTLLGQLQRIRADLDRHIASVEELIRIL